MTEDKAKTEQIEAEKRATDGTVPECEFLRGLAHMVATLDVRLYSGSSSGPRVDTVKLLDILNRRIDRLMLRRVEDQMGRWRSRLGIAP